MRVSSAIQGQVAVSILMFSGLLGFCWGYPHIYYNKSQLGESRHWLQERTTVAGWVYTNLPISKAAEAVLVADELVNGEFSNDKGGLVRVFSAKRIKEKQNEIGLFVHTPDRCWTESGWKLEEATPDSVDLSIHSARMIIERRIFVHPSGARELVYFGGMVNGQSLPYRLDHNLSVGLRHQLQAAGDRSGGSLRASDRRFWVRVWDSFRSRRPLLGPKQFIRISTPLKSSADLPVQDDLLGSFLPQWLEETEFSSKSIGNAR